MSMGAFGNLNLKAFSTGLDQRDVKIIKFFLKYSKCNFYERQKAP